MRPSPPSSTRLAWAGLAIGVAVDGLLDGAVLHQLLGWHHFLSGKTADPRANMVADGAFHLVMLATLVLGLSLAWHERARLVAPRSGRSLLGGILMGAGSFQVVDSVVAHWLLGLHHIHPEHPGLSDSLFFAMGLALVWAGVALARSKPANLTVDGPRGRTQVVR